MALGTTANASVTLVNQGSAGVQVSQISLAGQSFSVSGGSDLPITVPAGHTFNLSVSFSPAVTGPATGELTIASDAAVNGTLVVGLSGTGTATAAPNPPALSAFSCVSAIATGPASDICTVELSTAATSGGFTVNLTSNNTAVNLPAAVTVAEGSTAVSFTANVSAVSMTETATLTASAGGVAETFAVQVNAASQVGVGAGAPGLSGLNCGSSSMTGAGTDGCTASLNGPAPSGGFAVSLTSNNSAVSVPASVTVAAGATTGSFTAAIGAVSTAQTTTLTASASGVTETFALQLNAVSQAGTIPPVLSGLSCGSSSMTGAGTDRCTVSLSGPAPSGGFAVSLTSNNSAVSVPAGVTVAAGAASGSFTATLTAVTTAQIATLTASAGGVEETFALQLNPAPASQPGANPPALSGFICGNSSITGAGTDSCTVTLNAAAASGGFIVSLSSNNSAVTVPASIAVAAGATTGGFTAKIAAVSTGQTAMLTAIAGGVSEQFSLQLNVAAAGLGINATSIAFGNVQVNTAVTQSVELTASGPLPIIIAAATVQGTGFSISGATFPITLAVGQPATVEVTFDPTAAGAATGQLIIASTVLTSGTAVINLSGTGVLEEVNLTWDAPSSSPDPVAGYNVYRAPSGSTSYQQLNPSVVTQKSYIDLTVGSGQTYDYIVESVDASGNTSTPSNTASVTLP